MDKLGDLYSRGWALEDQKLVKNFVFNNFKEVVLFFNAIAYLAEKYNHHPDLVIGYKKCQVTLFTHSEGKVTDKDIELALKIEELVS
ncbi:MAG: 4a-hydroxytetrahydrobiopterin dehydratase [bacterium]